MSFDLTRGEIILVAFIFGLIYSSGFLPRLVKALAGRSGHEDTGGAKSGD